MKMEKGVEKKLSVSITADGGIVTVDSPYNADFVDEARRLGGRWDRDSEVWIFDTRDEGRVRDLCHDVYGTDGETSDMVDIRVTFVDPYYHVGECGPITLSGRPIARAFGRDSGAKLCDGVLLLSGKFSSGGSRKNWRTDVDEGTVVIVRDFPRAQIASLRESRGLIVEIESDSIDIDELRAERDRLMIRIEEIDSLLADSTENQINSSI